MVVAACAIVFKTSKMDLAEISPCPMNAAEMRSARSGGNKTSATESQIGAKTFTKRADGFGCAAELSCDAVDAIIEFLGLNFLD